MDLTAENVDTVIKDLLLTDEEADAAGISTEATPEQIEANGLVLVECLIHTFVFHPKRVAEQRDNIRSMLERLPDGYRASGGGGWSFLNLCVDKDDVQWTSFHRTQEALCALAIAADLGEWVLPRDLWGALPGGMPYFVYKDA